jgi:4-amino-4-deoxy-L-arabinose transferase-like glycosyltransferase
MPSPASPALFDQFARGWRGYVLIALIALTSGLMGAARVPVTDIDEARFAQATRQMIEDDDYVRIRVQDAERNRKPVGIYWLQAASVNALRPLVERLNTIWPYRLPSALGLALASLATLWAGSALLGPRIGFVGAAIFAVGLLAGTEGMLAKTDAVMTGFTTLALAAIAQLRVGTSRPRIVSLVFWAAIGCGIMIKGPITPLVAFLTLATLAWWERRAAWARPLAFWPGPLLAIAISLPWLVTIGVVTEGRFYTDLLTREIGPKFSRRSPRRHSGIFAGCLIDFPTRFQLPRPGAIRRTRRRSPRRIPLPHRGLPTSFLSLCGKAHPLRCRLSAVASMALGLLPCA